MTAARERCEGVLSSKRAGYGMLCSRKPTRHYVDRDGICLHHYCAQHASGKGVMRLLLPYPWTYDRVETYSYSTSSMADTPEARVR